MSLAKLVKHPANKKFFDAGSLFKDVHREIYKNHLIVINPNIAFADKYEAKIFLLDGYVVKGYNVDLSTGTGRFPTITDAVNYAKNALDGKE